MRETWYVLEDGSVVDPNDCAPDEAGVLTHSSGVPVAMRGQVPSSRGVDDADAERTKSGDAKARVAAAKAQADAEAKAKAEAEAKAKAEDEARQKADAKDVKPEEPKRGYKTRESKVD